MDIINNAVQQLNEGQVPVIAFDQPLYAIAKEIQWKWPEKYGEDKFVIMFGGLHIEMAMLKTIGDWLQGSGWTQALVQSDISTPGTADSFFEQDMSCVPGEHTKSLLQHYIFCNIGHMRSTDKNVHHKGQFL